MNRYRKGRRLEHRTQAVLETAGYTTIRAAGSKGVVDVVAWNHTGVRLVSVKSGTARPTPAEYEAMSMTPLPVNAVLEVWRWPDRSREPLIERINT